MKPYRTLREVQQDLTNNNISCESLVQGYVARIKENQDLNAFLEVYEQDALDAARAIDKKLKDGTAGRLAGMVIGLKDNIAYKGHGLTASSKILEGFESLFNATATERLLAEDAIIIGRLNCDEFAMGSSNENSAFGNVLNPLDKTRVPGGSSGGSVAAVAADLCLAALGSDTGGSIRQPASFCGIVGFKPTYGRISRHGLIAYASSFDQIGPVTHHVEDAALLYEIMAGPDEFDDTLHQGPAPKVTPLTKEDKKLRIAVISDIMESPGLNPEVKASTKSICKKLEQDGHTIGSVGFDLLDALVPAYFVLSTAEASSNLSRFDGIHYGYRSKETVDIPSAYKKSRTEGFGPEVKRRIMLGTFVLSAGYYDAYYAQAQKVRNLIKQRTEEILSDYDLIISPTTPHPAFKIGANADDPIAMYLEDVFTVQANLSGVPAISLPIGKHSNGMPFGIQLMGKPLGEKQLLDFSQSLMSLS